MVKSCFYKTLTVLLVLVFQLLSISHFYTGLSQAVECSKGMEYEGHNGLLMECCHIPSSVKDVYQYCHSLDTVIYDDDKEANLCCIPGKTRYRRQFGFVHGGLPGR